MYYDINFFNVAGVGFPFSNCLPVFCYRLLMRSLTKGQLVVCFEGSVSLTDEISCVSSRVSHLVCLLCHGAMIWLRGLVGVKYQETVNQTILISTRLQAIPPPPRVYVCERVSTLASALIPIPRGRVTRTQKLTPPVTAENPGVSNVLLCQVWSRSECSPACFAYCQLGVQPF